MTPKMTFGRDVRLWICMSFNVGDAVTKYLTQLLQDKGYSFSTANEVDIVNYIKVKRTRLSLSLSTPLFCLLMCSVVCLHFKANTIGEGIRLCRGFLLNFHQILSTSYIYIEIIK